MTHQDIIFELIAKGETSRDAMASETGLTLQQVKRAIQNLAYCGRVECIGQKSKGYHMGMEPGTFRVKVEKPQVTRQVVNSVWQLGAQ